MSEQKNSFSLDIAIEPLANVWFDEDRFIKIIQNEPKREIYLTRCEMEIWRLLSEDEYTGKDLIEMLRDKYHKETVIQAICKLKNYSIIGLTKNYLWKDE